MKPGVLKVLRSLNTEMLGGRWTDEDLDQLVTPRSGVVSSFASMSRDLTAILKKDLGDIPPDLRTCVSSGTAARK